MIEEVTLSDVREAWNEFNTLPKPWAGEGGRGGAPVHFYNARDAAWTNYTKVMDHYLYQIKAISLTDLNMKWYPRAAGYNQQFQ